ncbi:plasmid partitioning protein RepB C-terminal domain-containing protein [Bradyrhizobium yuanmingense]|uniref:plasmid partitioning protein RepB C-terminal domain-containing protein n=1 Tax=Bradyrhizobium yuanmingense TaxID=108015 RepID=UPI0007C6DA34|nr:plasmid partitioning protein RepB C-terminal domain-containing protein [Bradyrhizobium yuanmingense]
MSEKRVHSAFEDDLLILPLASLLPTKQVTDVIRNSPNYKAIACSIEEVGVIEPLIVYRNPDQRDRYLLLDGSLKRDILLAKGETETECLLATDDEAFTYNKRVSRLAIVQEHFMILRAIERGVSEQRIAKALNVDIAHIKRRRLMLRGICSQAVDLLRDKSVNPVTFDVLRKMKPVRQAEACQLMVSASYYSSAYAKALLAATKDSERVRPARLAQPTVVTSADLALMERELKDVQKSMKAIEASYGRDMLDLVIAARYVARLLANPKIAKYLDDNHPEIAKEFEAVVSAVLSEPVNRPISQTGSSSHEAVTS